MNIVSKLRDFIGFNNEPEYDYEYDETESERFGNVYQPPEPNAAATAAATAAEEERRQNRRMRERSVVGSTGTDVVAPSGGVGSVMNNVIGMPGSMNGISEVVVMEPRTFEEMPAAIRALKERKSVVLNLTVMDPDQAQRAVDFVAGGTYALDGHQERIGESIFLFTPSCVQVRTQSGVVHEVPPAQGRPRPAAAAPAPTVWPAEQAQLAQ
ncbi:MAG: cell division protein SepF [Microcoleus sp. PH2017_10_PVI_O_A]|uniref:cell division protein SepF n=1 Tax=unclassified Microcoleus TaxID=2642155 RepID=UPI001DED2573|nr:MULTISPECIES: cell division protein SepF [unclassified Microcoleus]TAE74723.1 MAG: cell division protein SepF [Oscillatoriales cyanobacterium]MCC3409634.1 cell division protein SepF [Microcoleus sp. PH2017_10_PVI_O_A]MCC3463889.1 cell division protein SepF [Microcoleus sp. PH2017_11_PCY_U_A]MCC3482235.1 cell division protein SepF [Microcoleus sp. PH2017_12_PCY_D_A]MCC3531986.1 cell division protein SepF [Microcoleus sp. PH2017_21_RUC_O_A]